MTTALPALQILEISGVDALAFAQAQFSADNAALGDGQWQWSAWLNAQGRVRNFFHLLRVNDSNVRLLLRGGSAEKMQLGLAKYVFRSKVRLSARAEPSVLGIRSLAELPAGVSAPVTPRSVTTDGNATCLQLSESPSRWVLYGGNGDSADPALLRSWQLDDIQCGLVTLDDAQSEEFVAAWLGLAELDAISVRKGCYPGQEIVARMHFKGGNKRWLRRLAFQGDTAPEPGQKLEVQSDPAAHGVVINAAMQDAGSGLALAVLPELPAGARLGLAGSSRWNFRVFPSTSEINP